MEVGLLTIEQKELLIGAEYTTGVYFNPIQDINDNWIISVEEINLCDNESFLWVKDLPLINYIAKEETEL